MSVSSYGACLLKKEFLDKEYSFFVDQAMNTIKSQGWKIKEITNHDNFSSILFDTENESRILFIFFEVQDYDDDLGVDEKVVFSLNCWGNYLSIMRVIGECLSEFGEIFIRENDHVNEYFEPRPNFKVSRKLKALKF